MCLCVSVSVCLAGLPAMRITSGKPSLQASVATHTSVHGSWKEPAFFSEDVVSGVVSVGCLSEPVTFHTVAVLALLALTAVASNPLAVPLLPS